MITDFRLKVFRAVAERLSFTRAADELFVTQPAVTKHINELEKQLGVPLFVRRRNAVALTPQGELLLGYVRRLLALYAELNDAFAGDGETFGGELAVGASTTISQYVLPAILSRFKKRYPEVRLTLCNGNTELIERMVADEKLDFGVIEGNAGNPQLHYETFMEDELVLVTASSNRSLRQEEIAAADLKKLPLVIRERDRGRSTSSNGRSLRAEFRCGRCRSRCSWTAPRASSTTSTGRMPSPSFRCRPCSRNCGTTCCG